jgi:hypothetical protein
MASLQLLSLLEAHDGVVLALDYSQGPPAEGAAPGGDGAVGGGGAGGGPGRLLASGGRDGLIHVFDTEARGAGWRMHKAMVFA